MNNRLNSGSIPFLAAILVGSASALASEFTPLGRGAENFENRTGLWVCPSLGSADEVASLGVRLYATQESVTDGVAMRVDFRKGSNGGFSMEHAGLPSGTAGLTMYAKASRGLRLTIGGRNSFAVGTEWQKIDIPWNALGTGSEEPNIGWEFKLSLQEPAAEDGWYIVDRLGCEGPQFDPQPDIQETRGPDRTINTAEIVEGAELLVPTVTRLKAKKPFTIFAIGDSVTAGAQMSRGNWSVNGEAATSFLYFGHLARLLKTRYGYSQVTYVQKGYGGWTSSKAKTIIARDLADATAADLIVIQFGGNDLDWAGVTIDNWLENTRALVAEAKKHTTQVIVMSITTGGNVPKLAKEISTRIRDFAAEEKVACVDVTRWSMYRGERYAWAYLANAYHPDFMGHMMIAEIMETLLGAPHFDWPEYAGNVRRETPK